MEQKRKKIVLREKEKETEIEERRKKKRTSSVVTHLFYQLFDLKIAFVPLLYKLHEML